MKTLVLVRHAKSSWDNPLLSDFDRPLNKRGKQDAPRMATCLKQLQQVPDYIVTSPARRALTTAQLFSDVFYNPAREPHIQPAIYEASATQLLHLVHQIDKTHSRVMLVGHNPGMTELLNALTGEAIDNVPTCGVAVVCFDVDDWAQVATDKGRLERFEYPKKEPFCQG